jgi:sulfite dehydrogenase
VRVPPEKQADLLVHTETPPNLETPPRYFTEDLTPNDAFYVRWHLESLPAASDPEAFRLSVGGHVERPLSLSLKELRALPAVEVVAVSQCSGNGRALFDPPVPGVQWRRGGMGNARWRGVSVRHLLDSAGVRQGAVDVVFGGLDRSATLASFEKSLTVDHARDGDVLVAYAMNDAPLPALHGFPLRLVVPGWYATYWVKALGNVTVLPHAFDGYWMAQAYRVPSNAEATETPEALSPETRPIRRLTITTLLVTPVMGARLPRGEAVELDGITFDGGTGIRRVDVSTDGGATYMEARLGKDWGNYSWRRWRATWTPSSPGPATILVRATSAAGEEPLHTLTQWNRQGYMRNVIERVDVTVT